MITMMSRPQDYILNNINNAAAIDHGFTQGWVSYEHLLKQNETEHIQPIDASLDG